MLEKKNHNRKGDQFIIIKDEASNAAYAIQDVVQTKLHIYISTYTTIPLDEFAFKGSSLSNILIQIIAPLYVYE